MRGRDERARGERRGESGEGRHLVRVPRGWCVTCDWEASWDLSSRRLWMRCRDLGAVVGGVGRRLWLWGRGLRSRWIDLAGGGWGGERGRTYGAAALPTVLLAWQRTKTPSPAERFVWLRTVAAAGKGVFATPSLSRATFRRSDVFQVGRESGIGGRGSGVGGRGSGVGGRGFRVPGCGLRVAGCGVGVGFGVGFGEG